MGSEVERLPAERVAENEVTFRRANETIGDFAHSASLVERIPFICECGEAACFQLVPLSLGEYEAVRQEATLFLVAPGHAITGPDLGRVVRTEPGYSVVEKIGISGEVARRRDPRTGEEAGGEGAWEK